MEERYFVDGGGKEHSDIVKTPTGVCVVTVIEFPGRGAGEANREQTHTLPRPQRVGGYRSASFSKHTITLLIIISCSVMHSDRPRPESFWDQIPYLLMQRTSCIQASIEEDQTGVMPLQVCLSNPPSWQHHPQTQQTPTQRTILFYHVR